MEHDRDLFEQAMRDIESRMHQSNELQQQIENLSVEAQSEDKLISLTVASPGFLKELRIDPRARRLDTETLAERITGMVNESLALLQETISEKVNAMFPESPGEELMKEFIEMRQSRKDV